MINSCLKQIQVLKFSRATGPGTKAFTLVELMFVVAIIGLIAGIVLGAAGGVQKKAARDQAKAEIKSMLVALERYRNERGVYPLAANNPSSSALYTNLTNYMTFRTNQISGQQVLDSYGYPYWYRLATNGTESSASSASMMSETVEVWSVGPNGKSGYTNRIPNRTDSNNKDDITSWN